MSLSPTSVLRGRANRSRMLRKSFLQQLYPVFSGRASLRNLNDPQGLAAVGLQTASDVVGVLNRVAGSIQTTNEAGGGRSSGIGSNGAAYGRQVERALAQVLGRAPGRDANSFLGALRETFPVVAYGKEIDRTPMRGALGLGSSSTYVTSSGLGGQLSAPQAALYREGQLVVGDAVRMLNSLTAYAPNTDPDQVESLRMRIRAQLESIVDEFGRLDEPRPSKVTGTLTSLSLHLAEFGRRASLTSCDDIVTPSDESQSVGLRLLQNYVVALRAAWERYQHSTSGESSGVCASLSQRLERARILLPIIHQGTVDLENAFDSLGFSAAERRSSAVRFSRLHESPVFTLPEFKGDERVLGARLNGDTGGRTDTALTVFLPDLTVSDLTDWLDRFATIDGPAALGDSGVYGLNSVADEANRLFWTVAPVVGYIRTTTPGNLVDRSVLGAVLAHERVGWALDNALAQLDTLADQALTAS